MSDLAADRPGAGPRDGPRLRIRAQALSRDAEVMGFVLDAPVQAGRSMRFDDPKAEGATAPLPRALFALDGVTRIEVAGTTIWVGKDASADWAALKPQVATAIRSVLAAHDAPLGPDSAAPADPDATLLAAIDDLLNRQVNPAVASHGGHIAVERVAGGTVYLRMSGGCQGCAASAATLREGVERMLRAALPQIVDIVDLTNHDAGSTPYYARDTGISPILSRPVPPGVIGWQDDGTVTVDPDFLAPRLGLSPDALRDGLRNGAVVGVTETGAGADAGKTRIVMRSATRAWAAEIDATGAAREIPPPRGAGTAQLAQDLASRARAHLEALAPEEAPITYGALARALGLWMPGSVRRVTQALEATMRADAAAGRPFIAARAISRAAEGLPGKGFFDLATELSRGPRAGQSDRAFHAEECERLAARAHTGPVAAAPATARPGPGPGGHPPARPQ